MSNSILHYKGRKTANLSNLGLKVAVSTRSTVTANQILKRFAMKNSIHYSKQNTAKAIHVYAALVSLGQQTFIRCCGARVIVRVTCTLTIQCNSTLHYTLIVH